MLALPPSLGGMTPPFFNYVSSGWSRGFSELLFDQSQIEYHLILQSYSEAQIGDTQQHSRNVHVAQLHAQRLQVWKKSSHLLVMPMSCFCSADQRKPSLYWPRVAQDLMYTLTQQN